MDDNFINPKVLKRSKFDRFFVSGMMAIIALVVAVFAYTAFAPVHLIDIKSANVETKTVSNGGTLIFDFNYCKHKNVDGLVYRYIVEKGTDNRINLPVVATVSYPGCHVARVFVVLPQGIPAGTYTLHGDNEYRLNGLRTLQVPFDTNEFQVTK